MKKTLWEEREDRKGQRKREEEGEGKVGTAQGGTLTASLALASQGENKEDVGDFRQLEL